MERVLVTFANGDVLELEEDQMILPLGKTECDGKIFVSQREIHTLMAHNKFGLLPTVGDLFCNCDFFSLVSNEDKIYCVSGVVAYERL